MRIRFWYWLSLAIWLATSTGAVQAGEWQRIKERGYLIVGVKQNFPPLGFQDAQGLWQGFEIDIARELAQELLGSTDRVRFIPLQNTDRFIALGEDRVDIVIAQVTVTSNRRRLVDFSPAYYTDGTFLIYAKENPIKSLPKPKIGVLKGSTAIAVLQFQRPQAIIVSVNSYQEGWDALQSAKIDAFAGDGTAITNWLAQYPQFQRSEQSLYYHSLAVALPRGLQYNELRKKIFNSMEKLKAQGWFERRAQFWGLP